jgi:hypothetical protein
MRIAFRRLCVRAVEAALFGEMAFADHTPGEVTNRALVLQDYALTELSGNELLKDRRCLLGWPARENVILLLTTSQTRLTFFLADSYRRLRSALGIHPRIAFGYAFQDTVVRDRGLMVKW